MDATQRLAQEITSFDQDRLSPDEVTVAHQIVLDGSANMLAGSQEPLGQIKADYIRELGGPTEATVVGHNFRTHPIHAAYANGVFGHSMDYELMWYPPTHPTSPTLPALLALAESRGYSGRDVITALAVAFEVQGRLRLAIHTAAYDRESIHPPGQVGPLGSAAGCANLLGLSKEETRMALGLAGSRVGGLSANTGTMTKSTHCGNAGRMGLESALLVERGFTASKSILEAPRGYNRTFFDGELDLDLVVEDFGDPFRMVDPGLSLKKYPSQYSTHWSIDAAIDLRDRFDLTPDEIDTVVVDVWANNKSARLVPPETGLAGKFSIQYTVAAALLDGDVKIDTFTDERRFAADMEAMLERITVNRNLPDTEGDYSKRQSRVTISTRDGEELTTHVDWPLGSFKRPVGWDYYLTKYHECAAQVLEEPAADELAQLIEEFEALDDVQPVMDLLSGAS